jgi:hypothetical protein
VTHRANLELAGPGSGGGGSHNKQVVLQETAVVLWEGVQGIGRLGC